MFDQLSRQLIGFPTRRAIAHRDQRHPMLLHQARQLHQRLIPLFLRRMRVDRSLVNKLARCIHHRHFAAGPPARINR